MIKKPPGRELRDQLRNLVGAALRHDRSPVPDSSDAN